MKTIAPDQPLMICGHAQEVADLPVGNEPGDAFFVADNDYMIAWFTGDEWVWAPKAAAPCPTCGRT